MRGGHQIDSQTEVPIDLFEELLRAGKQTRQHGQHRQIKGCGRPHLVLTGCRSSPGLHQPAQPGQSRDRPVESRQRATRKDQGASQCSLPLGTIEPKPLNKLFSANASAASQHVKAIAEKTRLSKAVSEKSMPEWQWSETQPQARRVHKDDITMAGSGYKAVTLLKQKRNSSLPAPRITIPVAQHHDVPAPRISMHSRC